MCETTTSKARPGKAPARSSSSARSPARVLRASPGRSPPRADVCWALMRASASLTRQRRVARYCEAWPTTVARQCRSPRRRVSCPLVLGRRRSPTSRARSMSVSMSLTCGQPRRVRGSSMWASAPKKPLATPALKCGFGTRAHGSCSCCPRTCRRRCAVRRSWPRGRSRDGRPSTMSSSSGRTLTRFRARTSWPRP